jgi:diguanylate cyclase (GGDEF)-like protein
MDAKDLLWFSSGFRTVEAWRDAMGAHGYRVPVHLCHGLHEAMQYLDLTFPAAFRLLWVNRKIFVNGRVLVYDFSVSDLWAAAKRPASTPPAGAIPSAVAWDRDVLALIPATEEILHLNSAWCLTADSSPLMKLALWRPGEDDEDWRRFLLAFGHEVAAAAWKRPDRPEGAREDQEYARLKELAFKDGETGLYNRRLFSMRLEGEVSRHRRLNLPVSVVLLHLDGLGRFRDERGRAAAQEVSRTAAEVLLRHTRAINVLARYDSELFAIVLVETSLAGARLYVDRIRRVLSSSTGGHEGRITARFGAAGLPDCKAVAPEDLFRLAEESLHATKRGSSGSRDRIPPPGCSR